MHKGYHKQLFAKQRLRYLLNPRLTCKKNRSKLKVYLRKRILSKRR